MFNRKSTPSTSSTNSKMKRKNDFPNTLSHLGLMDMPGIEFDDNGNVNDNDNDSDLEAELLALTNGSVVKPKKKTRTVVDPLELDKMVKDSLRDIPSDEEMSSDEDDGLIAELANLKDDDDDKIDDNSIEPLNPKTTSSDVRSMQLLLEERLRMYETAESKARNTNEAAKARRMKRGVDTLKSLLKTFKSGGKIDENNIPPAINVPPTVINQLTDPVVSAPAPLVNVVPESPQPSGDMLKPNNEVKFSPPPIPPRANNIIIEPDSAITKIELQIAETHELKILKERQTEYKMAALEAKRSNDRQTALNYVKIVKQFESIITAASEGSPVDISTIPPSPHSLNFQIDNSATKLPSIPIHNEEIVQTSQPQPMPLPPQTTEIQVADTVASPATPPSNNPPKSTMEGLTQCLQKYKADEDAAKRENNSSKARRLGRVVKQYEDAIRLHKAGKPFPVGDLPIPYGFAPIPVDGAPKSDSVAQSPPVIQSTPTLITPDTPKLPSCSKSSTSPTPTTSADVTSRLSTDSLSRSQKLVQMLTEKQKLFKIAALKAKREGDIELAKEYLKSAKGFDAMIEAAQSGLRVDLTSIPVAPSEKINLETKEDNEVIMLSSAIEGSDIDVYQKLLTDLQHQLEMCMKTKDHFKAMGDVVNANRFEQLAVQTKKDFKFVQLAANSNLKLPKFHYESKPFTLVHCNTDLTDNDFEVNVVQGVNYNVNNPKTIDTYIKVIFPYPTETPQQFKSQVIYDTNNPAYNETTLFAIQRNARACKRIFVRNTLKCEVWSKGGFFRSDALLGTATIKLQPLEKQCTLHDAYNIMDGRKEIGKLEVKIRMRDPINQKQIEHVQEKWLIIDT